MKRNLIVATLVISTILLTACGGESVLQNAETDISQNIENNDDLEKQEDDVNGNSSDENATMIPESNDEKQTLGDGESYSPVESSTAKKLWRVYKMDQEDSSMDRYLYLEIFQDSGNVEIYHSYYAENTYSYESWPISDGIIEVKEFSADGGAPNTWNVYFEYSPQVIKLYSIDDNTGEVSDSYDEFIFESEEVLD